MKNNNYNEIINVINKINEGEIETTEEEKELINDLSLVIDVDRTNKISEYIIERNRKLDDLIRTINEKLKYYIEEDGRYLSSSTIRLSIIDNLNRVKCEINKFKKNQYQDNLILENKLIEKCLHSISITPFAVPCFFDEFIAIKRNKEYYNRDYHILNKELIDKLYDLVNKDTLMEELDQGTRIISNKSKYESIVDKCNVSLSYKELVKNNSDLIIEFNRIVKDIERVIEKRNNEQFLGIIKRERSNNATINYLESYYTSIGIRKLNDYLRNNKQIIYIPVDTLENNKEKYFSNPNSNYPNRKGYLELANNIYKIYSK